MDREHKSYLQGLEAALQIATGCGGNFKEVLRQLEAAIRREIERTFEKVN